MTDAAASLMQPLAAWGAWPLVIGNALLIGVLALLALRWLRPRRATVRCQARIVAALLGCWLDRARPGRVLRHVGRLQKDAGWLAILSLPAVLFLVPPGVLSLLGIDAYLANKPMPADPDAPFVVRIESDETSAASRWILRSESPQQLAVEHGPFVREHPTDAGRRIAEWRVRPVESAVAGTATLRLIQLGRGDDALPRTYSWPIDLAPRTSVAAGDVGAMQPRYAHLGSDAADGDSLVELVPIGPIAPDDAAAATKTPAPRLRLFVPYPPARGLPIFGRYVPAWLAWLVLIGVVVVLFQPSRLDPGE